MILREAKRFDASVRLLDRICKIAHPTWGFLASATRDAGALQKALRRRDTEAIYDWLMIVFSYQGIADKSVDTILARDGSVTWKQIDETLLHDAGCSKLRGFWAFSGCGFSKLSRSCNSPTKFESCHLPRLTLRNGALSQLAYSLYFFMRDVANRDFFGWLDQRVSHALEGGYLAIEEHLIAPMRSVFGISDKVISMALSELLLASDLPAWRQLGAEFIVIDRLVHNFLHRSGILRRHKCEHLYGRSCYAENGCAKLLLSLSRGIDTRRFHNSFLQPFPRFVQLAIWRFCAASGENICNGNKIDDAKRCQNEGCNLQSFCERVSLRKGQ